jgi:hypothetical protein
MSAQIEFYEKKKRKGGGNFSVKALLGIKGKISS